MPTLDWIDKSAVDNRNREVPVRLLHRDRAESAHDLGNGFLISSSATKGIARV